MVTIEKVINVNGVRMTEDEARQLAMELWNILDSDIAAKAEDIAPKDEPVSEE